MFKCLSFFHFSPFSFLSFFFFFFFYKSVLPILSKNISDHHETDGEESQREVSRVRGGQLSTSYVHSRCYMFSKVNTVNTLNLTDSTARTCALSSILGTSILRCSKSKQHHYNTDLALYNNISSCSFNSDGVLWSTYTHNQLTNTMKTDQVVLRQILEVNFYRPVLYKKRISAYKQSVSQTFSFCYAKIKMNRGFPCKSLPIQTFLLKSK